MFSADFIITFGLLYLLAVTDCTFASYRSSGARNSRINKGSYYARACLNGMLWAQVPVAISAAIAFALLQTASDPTAVLKEYIIVGHRMLMVYLPYAAFSLGALLIRLLPIVDARTLAQVLVLGPFMIIRPLVAIAGILFAASGVHEYQTLLVIAPTIIMMLLMQPVFDHFNKYPDFVKRHSF